MGVGGGGDACFSMREEGTTAERLRGTRQKREKQREAACCKHLAGGKRRTEDKRGGGKKSVASLYPDKVH